MASQSDTVFPLIPAPMALAVDTISSAAASASARRSPVPSRSAPSADRTATPPTTTTQTPPTAMSPSSGPTTATATRAKNPRHPVFNEDIFSKLYTTPFLVLHFALYGAVPFYYLLHYSPFRDFAGSGAANEAVKWFLFVLAQYITAVIVTSWGGRYRVHKDVGACALMLACLTGGTVLKALVDRMADSRG